MASITLSVPIFSGGTTSARRRQTRNQAFAAEDLRNLSERNTIQNTRTLHRSVVTDSALVDARLQAIVSSQSSLDATQAGYEVGTRTLVDVLNAQSDLYDAQRSYYDALYAYISNTLGLNQAAGLLSPEDLQQLDAKLNPGSPVSRADALATGTTR